MKIIPVSCQNCGASLDIPGSARFVTCQFCNTQLAVQHTGSAMFTELMGQLHQKTDRMAENLEVIRIQNEIEKLDREWREEKDRHMIRGKHGKVSESDAATSVFTGILCIFISGGLLYALREQQGGAFAVLGIVLGLYGIILGPIKAAAYEKAREAYLTKRNGLESRLNVRE